ncbi:hypothetical protein GPECTOR_13g621 [Gonium pectorale]|uniref:Uncharacterized protein n=1 Tax=Gonium pectorale TaxID=33097 RepID=A0A150GMV6_GONPE|nr:hypothetical protein GPECTOR_13g621 [Gonium pectorale]|eukprot:KXZ51134.1 hypothetical protein GPECTOR_13g621 [Gonium pectorale]
MSANIHLNYDESVERARAQVHLDLPRCAILLQRLLAAVDLFPLGGLYAGHYAEQAIRRYWLLWMPLLYTHQQEGRTPQGTPLADGRPEGRQPRPEGQQPEGQEARQDEHQEQVQRLQGGGERKEGEAGARSDLLMPPLDVQWAWFVHRLNPIQYAADCEARFGPGGLHAADELQALGFCCSCCPGADDAAATSHASPAAAADGSTASEGAAASRSGGGASSSSSSCAAGRAAAGADARAARGGPGTCGRAAPPSWELPDDELRRRVDLTRRVLRAPYTDPGFLSAGLTRYHRFLGLAATQPPGAPMLVPMYDIDLMWHAHMALSAAYAADCAALLPPLAPPAAQAAATTTAATEAHSEAPALAPDTQLAVVVVEAESVPPSGGGSGPGSGPGPGPGPKPRLLGHDDGLSGAALVDPFAATRERYEAVTGLMYNVAPSRRLPTAVAHPLVAPLWPLAAVLTDPGAGQRNAERPQQQERQQQGQAPKPGLPPPGLLTPPRAVAAALREWGARRRRAERERLTRRQKEMALLGMPGDGGAGLWPGLRLRLRLAWSLRRKGGNDDGGAGRKHGGGKGGGGAGSLGPMPGSPDHLGRSGAFAMYALWCLAAGLEEAAGRAPGGRPVAAAPAAVPADGAACGSLSGGGAAVGGRAAAYEKRGSGSGGGGDRSLFGGCLGGGRRWRAATRGSCSGNGRLPGGISPAKAEAACRTPTISTSAAFISTARARHERGPTSSHSRPHRQQQKQKQKQQLQQPRRRHPHPAPPLDLPAGAGASSARDCDLVLLAPHHYATRAPVLYTPADFCLLGPGR